MSDATIPTGGPCYLPTSTGEKGLIRLMVPYFCSKRIGALMVNYAIINR